MSFTKYKLDEYTRRASLGDDYNLLKSYNPDWGRQLHSSGNTLDNEVLELIAKEGIIRWYCKYSIGNYLDLDYPAVIKIDILKNNIKDVTYYDWVNIVKLCKYFEIDNPFFTEFNFCKGWKFNFIQDRFPKKLEYYQIPMGKILLTEYPENDIKILLAQVNERLKEIKYYYYHGSIFDTFLKENPEIINFGIAFQRLKIVLEKMPVISICAGAPESSLANPDIYKFDKLCDDIQECIYSWIKSYFDEIKNNEIVPKISKENVEIDYSKVELFLNKIEDIEIHKLRF